MKRILFVDDDPLVLRIYKEALSAEGYSVEAALDGSSASKILQNSKPDLLVLDLMMSGNQGVDLLNLVRSEQKLADLTVIAFSNSYLEAPSRESAPVIPQKTLLKVRCTPSILLGVIRELLPASPGQVSNPRSAQGPARSIPERSPDLAKRPPDPNFLPKSRENSAPVAAAPQNASTDEEFRAKARQHFLQNAGATCEELHESFQRFARAKTEEERQSRLQLLYRQVHFIAASAGLAESHAIARMASVFEAMLFEITNQSAVQNASILRTMAQAVDFFRLLFKKAGDPDSDFVPTAKILVVDDDALSNRVVVSALRHAQLQAVSTEDPLMALQWLQKEQYALVLLDIEMPGMDGFELCKRIRKLPGYRKTPVVYVTSHTDFESRAKSALAGGDDLIAKPVFHMELAVKAMTHLLKSQLAARQLSASEKGTKV